MDTIDQALATADKAWRAHGVRRADRATLAADLRLDLEAAAADGVPPEQLLDGDVAGFARRLADEAGLHREPAELDRLLGTALFGAVIGAGIGGVLIYVVFPAFIAMTDLSLRLNLPVQVGVGLYFGIPAAIVVAAAVVAVRLGLPQLAHIRSTCRAMAALLPIAGLAITPITMGFAWTTGYSDAPPVVLMEVLIVLAALAGATVLARHWALREPAPGPKVSA